jgi:hypothetical protein
MSDDELTDLWLVVAGIFSVPAIIIIGWCLT